MNRVRCVLISLVIFIFAGCTVSFAADRTVVSEAEVVSGGDLLISREMLENTKKGNKYDFSYIFKYVDEYIKEADYAVVNLETSIGGKALGYSGFPWFNTPESIVTAAENAGFDMFLTASNHSYDQGYKAVKYRLSVLDKKDLDYIGTRKTASGNFHKVINVNGIKIGMLNYTQEAPTSTKNRVVLNYIGSMGGKEVVVGKDGKKLISSYNNKYITEFYSRAKKDIAGLKSKGADIIVVYPHWGKEYNIGYNDVEDKIAQKLCDYGADVIIGAHPHVVEPTKVYTSKVSGKTTICLHSMGNFVSNMGAWQKEKKNAPYSQDGALFKYTVKKYSDGTAAVTKADVLPLYVHRNNGKNIVIPLDRDANWNKFGIKKYSSKKSGYKSYHRTMNLVKPGLKKFNAMPKISKQPYSRSKVDGETAVYKVAAVGKNIKYQWQYSTDGGKTWKNSAGNGNKTETLNVGVKKTYSGRYYRCRVKNGTGTVYSRKAKLTVK